MSDNTNEVRNDVLRAIADGAMTPEAGGRLLDRLNASTPAEQPETEQPQRQLTPEEAYEAQRRAQGQQLLDQLNAQIGNQWHSTPALDA